MPNQKYFFATRQDAASQLREILPLDQVKNEAWNLIAVSKGGLALASHMNERLKRYIDFLFSESISAPQNSGCEVARVSETEEIVMHENLVKSFDIQVDYIYGEANRKHEEKILSSIYKYRKGRSFDSMEGKVVILVDEGAETGMKMMTAIKTIMAMKPKAVHIAVPILPSDVLDSLEPLVDRIYYLHDVDDFIDTPSYYGELPEVDDKTIANILGE
jgi:putative phosphoribosyl transferase